MNPGRNIEIALRLAIGDFTAKLGAAGAQARSFGQDLAKVGDAPSKSLDKVGKGALVMGGLVGAGFALAVHAAMEFDSQMSAVQGASSATTDELSQLRDAALDAGATTIYSASEAAKAQEELAKAGVSVADILSGGLKGALDLAAAGNLDLGRAAEIAANAMTTFSLSGGDVPRIADTLAAAAGKSAAGVEDMAQAMQQSGLVASQLGLDVDDTAAALALFAQNGLRGSDAGTSFKTALMRLVPQTEAQATAMEELGLNFFDANGKFVGLEGAAEQLQSRLGGLTQEQRLQAETTIFGSDAIRAAEILYRSGGEGVAEWTEAVNDSGYAAELAATKNDNLKGDLEQLRGAIETTLIQTGEKGTGALRGLTQGLTDVVAGLSALDGPAGSAATLLTGLLGAGAAAAGGAAVALPKYRELLKALQDMGPAGTQVATGLSAVTKGLALAAPGLIYSIALWGDIQEQADEAYASFTRDWTVPTTYSQQAEQINALIGEYNRLSDVASEGDGLIGFFREFDQNLPGASGNTIANAQEATHRYADAIEELMPGLENWSAANKQLQASLGLTQDEIDALAHKAGVDLSGDVGKTTAAVESFYWAMQAGPPAVIGVGVSLDGMGEKTKSAEEKLKDLTDALKAFLDIAFSNEEAADAITRKLNQLAASAFTGKLAFEGNSEAALDFRDQMRGLVDAAGDQITTWANLGIQGDDLKVKVYLLSQSLIDQATKMGIPRQAAEEYFGKLNEIPEEVYTDIWADTEGTGAQVAADNLGSMLDRIDRGAHAKVTIDLSQYGLSTEEQKSQDAYDRGFGVKPNSGPKVGTHSLDGRQVYGLDQKWHPVEGRAAGGPMSPWSVYEFHDTPNAEVAQIGTRSFLFTGAQGGQATNLGAPYARLALAARAQEAVTSMSSSTSNVYTDDNSVNVNGNISVVAPDAESGLRDVHRFLRRSASIGRRRG